MGKLTFFNLRNPQIIRLHRQKTQEPAALQEESSWINMESNIRPKVSQTKRLKYKKKLHTYFTTLQRVEFKERKDILE